MSNACIRAGVVTCVLSSAAVSLAQVVVNQEPTRHGGDISDTAFDIFPGHVQAQLLADDFTLAEAASVTEARWWGFYNSVPSDPEAIRFRIHESRPSDGLPGDIIFEQIDPAISRSLTGHTVNVSGLPPEYLFSLSLSQAVALQAGVRYWVELCELDKPEITFHWEGGFGGNGVSAAMVPGGTDWYYISSPSGAIDEAFQLVAPEPGVIFLLSAGLLAVRRHKSWAARHSTVKRARASRSCGIACMRST